MGSIQVGLVGTGYAAKVRAEALQADERSHLSAVVGYNPEKTAEFSQTFGAEALPHWSDLVQRPELDLIVISNVSSEHGAIARAALQAGKHVVVEYPLSLDVADAAALIDLAQAQNKLLHVEHIELLSGIHCAIKAALPAIGQPFYACYTNLTPQRPAPDKWTYHHDRFGFPLMGALSRIHRLTDLFGSVAQVSCQAKFTEIAGTTRYTTGLCKAQLEFSSGVLADLIYGKGEAIWQAGRSLQIHGEQGAILVDGDQGSLVLADGEPQVLDMGVRRGLFARDTAQVLDHLTQQTPLYVSATASLYALTVADAARRAAETGQPVRLE